MIYPDMNPEFTQRIKELSTRDGVRILNNLGISPADLNNMTFLDVGAGGICSLERYLQGEGIEFNAYAIDSVPGVLDQEDLISTVGIQRDIREGIPKIPDKSLDLIVASSVPLKYEDVLPEFHRILKKGGEVRIAPSPFMGGGEYSTNHILRERLLDKGGLEALQAEDLQEIKTCNYVLGKDGLPVLASEGAGFWDYYNQRLTIEEQQELNKECFTRLVASLKETYPDFQVLFEEFEKERDIFKSRVIIKKL